MKEATERYVLIDGHSLAYRAYYALPADLATSSGQTTNAVYGFTSMLIKVLEDLHPTSVVVAFDKGRPEFRLEQFEEYKAHRKPMPDPLREQMEIIRAVLEAMGIPFMEVEGYEADDLLATLVDRLPRDAEVYIVTGDRDALQLVDERVRVVANRRGITDIVIYDREKVKERYGVLPEQIVDYLALKGDTSDNIPGVPGIGEKTAAALIGRFGSLDAVYESLEKVENPKWRRLLQENRESAFLSRGLARLRKDVPVEIPPADRMRMRPWDEEALRRLFDTLEFRKFAERLESLRRELFPETTSAPGPGRFEGIPQTDATVTLEDLLKHVERNGEIFVYPRLEGEGYTRGRMIAATFMSGGFCRRLVVEDERDSLLLLLRRLTDMEGVRVNCYRGKDFMVQCAKECRVVPDCDFDVQLASYLIHPSGTDHDLESSAGRYLDVCLRREEAGQLGLIQVEEDEAREDVRRVSIMRDLVSALEAEMNLRHLTSLFREVEIPLQRVLAEMEICGVRLDTEVLARMEEDLKREIQELESEAHRLAGQPFNLNSPQQLSHVLFEVLRLPPVKRTKTGYATDVSVLTSLRDKHPIVNILLRHRELSKLLGTYISALPRLVDPSTGRLHASFNQTVTATGRLSSSNPNLQNIPIRTPLGRKIRRAFIPTSPEGFILAADYSQIELRILAHLSGDPGLKKAFEEGLDIHAATASEVFGVPYGGVDPELRRRAKAINFGIIYGMSPYGLAEQLGIETDEAERYIDSYFQKYPEVRSFLDRTVEEACRNGYVTTILGRRREIPELLEGNHRLRRLGERLAFNTPIQGSAADIIKLAMVRIHRRLNAEGLRSRMILQVHDELVFDVEKGEVEAMRALVREEMESAYLLDVPLVVEIGVGASWYEAK